VGLGTTAPWEDLHLEAGNMMINSANEQQIAFRRSGTVGFHGVPTAPSNNPMFKMGRIIAAGDGSPEFRFLFQDDTTPERAVFEFDEKGIVASVKPTVGSHFEGFIAGDPEPLFRLNSYPSMQLEMGPGGTTPTDVSLRRADVNTLTILTGGIERLRVNGAGNLGVGVIAPQSKLAVSGLPTAPPDASGNAGVVCVTNNGNFWLDNDGTADCL